MRPEDYVAPRDALRILQANMEKSQGLCPARQSVESSSIRSKLTAPANSLTEVSSKSYLERNGGFVDMECLSGKH